MLRLLPFLPLIVCAAPLTTPTVPGPASPPQPEEVRAFSGQLVGIADEISRMYVRPVARKELLRSALTGLYEAMHQPVPNDLAAELDRAESVALPGTPPSDANAPPFDVNRAALMNLAAQLRLDLGDAEKLRKGNDLRIGIQGMLKCLDPYCTLVTAEDLRRGQMMEEGREDFGLGATADGAAGVLRVTSVVLGGPAQRAGLRPGDEITHVQGDRIDAGNGESYVTSLTLAIPRVTVIPYSVEQHLQEVEVTVHRPGQETPRRVVLEYAHYEPELVLGVRRETCGAWMYWLDEERKIAHVRIGSLEHGVADELTNVLTQLKEDGLRGLVLDLRWSPGGFLVEATRLAGLFIQDGVIARTRAKGRLGQWEEQEYTAHGVTAFLDFPMVVLVNGETSGGAELVAAALQDHGRAVIVGQRTLGKASIQTQQALPLENTGLKLTNGTFFRPNGQSLHRFPDSQPSDAWGVRPKPEHETPVSADLSRLLRDRWLQLSLRPGAECEMLPLDDPENDPQRQAALRVLLGMVK